MDMSEAGIRPCGTRLDGEGPQDLVLSDGSRLVLKSGETEGHAHWCRRGNGDTEELPILKARELAGPEFCEYVEVRMRSEAEWLRALAQWAGAEAERIDAEAAVLI
jgi:hypothetical protein